MRLLLIDTCGTEGTIGLADTAAACPIVATDRLPGRSASERLVPGVRGLLEAHGWRLSELAAIVVVHGPGSFTGVRVGLSAAKGFSEASEVGLVAVSRLAVLASLARGDDQTPPRKNIHVALDAGRGEFYYGRYQDDLCLTEALLTRAELEEAVGSQRLIVCEMRVQETLPNVALTVVADPRAQDALGIALNRVADASFDDAAVIDANYLRRTDAQLFARPAAR